MSAPIVIDIDDRTKDDRLPAEELTFAADLTGHTVHLVIETNAGVEVDAIAGSLVVASGSTAVTFAITALAVGTAGYFRYSVILDRATAAARETKVVGSWTVTDHPG